MKPVPKDSHPYPFLRIYIHYLYISAKFHRIKIFTSVEYQGFGREWKYKDPNFKTP